MNATSNALNQTPPALIVPLEGADQAEIHGGKAANLARVLRLGWRVPPGFVVTNAAFEAFLTHNKLEAVRSLLAGETADADHAQRLHDAVMHAPLPPALTEALRGMAPPYSPDRPLIARSSAIGEDGLQHSFAGQLESVLDVGDEPALAQAIRAVWASALSPRRLAYTQAGQSELRGIAVLVQRQVDAYCAGVLFTRTPDGRDADTTMYAEFVAGHPEPLVAGRVTPGHLRLSRDDAGIEASATQGYDEAFAAITRASRTLLEAGLNLETHFGAPQDIEWALEGDGQLTILQSRPITRVQQGGERRVVWSSANINENFPTAVTPFVYSVVQAGYARYFRNLGLALGASRRRIARVRYQLQNTVGVQQGYLYYNLSNIHDAIRAVPFGEHLTGLFNTFVGTPESDTEASGTRRTRFMNRVSEYAARARMVATTLVRYLFLERGLKRFEASVDRYAADTTPDALAAQSTQAHLALLRRFMDIRCNGWTNASLADFAAMVTSGHLEQLAAQANPQAAEANPHHALLKGLPNLISAQPVQALWQLAERIRGNTDLQGLFRTADSAEILARLETDPAYADFHAAFRAYLQQWGFRRSGELTLTVPSFEERPAPVIDLLKAYVFEDTVDPVTRLAAQAQYRREATEAIAAQLRDKRLFRRLPAFASPGYFRMVLRATHKAVAWRERARLKQALLYTRLRSLILTIGEHLSHDGILDSPEQVFFLTYPEIEAYMAGTSWAPTLLRQYAVAREAHFADLPSQAPPETLILAPGEYATARPADGASFDSGEGHWRGIGACNGRITGRAVILNDISETAALQPGDILVVRQTDPGWAAVFPIIAGLVVERGGMLSHGAIVAREFGVPAVVGVEAITSQLTSGTRIEIDGGSGDVAIVA